MVIALADPSTLLNKRAEIVSTCRHRAKFRHDKACNAPTQGCLNSWFIYERPLGPFLWPCIKPAVPNLFACRLFLLTGKVKAIQHTQIDHKRTTWTEHYPTMLVSLAPNPWNMKYELCLNGLLLADILPYPLFHSHVRLPVTRVCFAVCLMSHSFRYPQLTASGYLNLASVWLQVQIHVAWWLLQPCSMKPWVAISMWSDSPQSLSIYYIYIYIWIYSRINSAWIIDLLSVDWPVVWDTVVLTLV